MNVFGSESCSGKKIRWPATAVWVRIPSWAQIINNTMKRKIRFKTHFQPIKDWLYFENFFLLPTICIFSLNTYRRVSDNYLYTRYIKFYWLWFDIGIQWEYGDPEKLSR